MGYETRNRTHDIHNAGVAVAAGTQHGVCIYNRRGFCPAEDIALSGFVANLIQIAGAGKGIFIHQSQFLQLLFIICLLGIHEVVENKVLQEIRRHILVQRPGINRELLSGNCTGINQLLHQIEDRLHHLQAEGRDQMVEIGRDRHHLIGTKGFTIHNKGLHDLCHRLTL